MIQSYEPAKAVLRCLLLYSEAKLLYRSAVGSLSFHMDTASKSSKQSIKQASNRRSNLDSL